MRAVKGVKSCVHQGQTGKRGYIGNLCGAGKKEQGVKAKPEKVLSLSFFFCPAHEACKTLGKNHAEN